MGKEYHLRDDAGADGFIDILARDRYGNVVVIELKRSGKTATSALNQLHKYAELLRSSERLKITQIRCMLVSTDWHDLTRAFSSFSREMPYPLDGFQLNCAPNGDIVDVTRMDTVSSPGHVTPTTAHMILLFESRENRDSAFVKVAPKFAQVGAPHLIGLRLEQIEQYSRLRYALYLVVGTMDRDDPRSEALTRVADNAEVVEEEPPDSLEHSVFDVISLRSVGVIEDGYVDKLRGMLYGRRFQWRITGLDRSGAFAEQMSSIEDQWLIDSIIGLRGVHQQRWVRLSSPRLRSHWSETREMIRNALRGDWTRPVELWLDEMEQAHRDRDVRVYLRDPGLLRYLMCEPSSGRPRSPSKLEIVFLEEPRAVGPIVGLCVELAWNGSQVDITRAASDAGGDSFLTPWAGAAPREEEEFLRLLGLRFVALEVSRTGTATALIEEEGGSLIRREHDRVDFEEGLVIIRWNGALPFEDFVRSHRKQLVAFKNDADAHRIYPRDEE